MIVLVPFDLATIDSTGELVPSMLDLSKKYLASPGRTKDFVAIFVGKFLTRPDMQSHALEFITWGLS
jgi:hypothetical protein